MLLIGWSAQIVQRHDMDTSSSLTPFRTGRRNTRLLLCRSTCRNTGNKGRSWSAVKAKRTQDDRERKLPGMLSEM